MEFKVIAPGGDEIEIINQPPSQTSGLIFTNETIAKAEFGKMIFRHYKGDEFDIWYSNYLINHTTVFTGRADIPVLELHIQFQNSFDIEWDNIGKQELTPFQFNLSHTPFVNNIAKFGGGKEYSTFDIHFTKHFLSRLSSSFPKLDAWLHKVEKKIAGDIVPVNHFLTPEMIAIVHHILKCSFRNNAAKFYIEAKIMELLLLALEHVSGDNIPAPIKLSPYDIEMLEEVRNMILDDFETKHSLLEIARKVGINDYKLKKGFKHRYGKSIYEYQLNARLEYAKKLIEENKMGLDEIAMLTGYGHSSNLITRFKKVFGYTPKYLRK